MVVLSVFVKQATPFLEEFFIKLDELAYPKAMMSLFIYNAVHFIMDNLYNWRLW